MIVVLIMNYTHPNDGKYNDSEHTHTPDDSSGHAADIVRASLTSSLRSSLVSAPLLQVCAVGRGWGWCGSSVCMYLSFNVYQCVCVYDCQCISDVYMIDTLSYLFNMAIQNLSLL